ncbi:MAG TPA: FCD domain-containing protein [Alphaproteobacteria bacterium]|nr:FCD domain-containing protein [Alphaproteobacteria bacterium]
MAGQNDATLGRLTAMIGEASAADGRLPPERALASQLGVSRRAVRRALERLAADGQVVRRQGAGTFITGFEAPAGDPFRRAIELTNPVEVLEVRLALEPMLTRLAALRASRCDIDKLNELAEATRTAPTPTAYEQADAAFHRRVALAARNALFLAVFDAVIAAIEDASWHGVRENAHCSKNKAAYSAFHREIADAIARRDCDRAEERMFAHLNRVQENLRTAIQPRLGTFIAPPAAENAA